VSPTLMSSAVCLPASSLDIKVGDTVLYSKYGGTEVSFGGDDLLILTSRDVLAIVAK